MRISDWSSDVCSSDLLVVEDAGVDAHEHVYGMAEAAGHLGRRDSHAEHHRGVGRTRWPMRVGVLLAREEALGVSDAREAQRRRTSVDMTRSEEHTSELQSLMRISYAVFCLKKKKKTHNRII